MWLFCFPYASMSHTKCTTIPLFKQVFFPNTLHFKSIIFFLEDLSNPEKIWDKIDRELVQGIDAADNGVLSRNGGVVRPATLSAIISGFNPTWDSSESPDEAFAKAVAFAEVVFDNLFASAVSTAKAEGVVERAIEQAQDHVMVLEQFVPWQNTLFESENNKAGDVLYVVFPRTEEGGTGSVYRMLREALDRGNLPLPNGKDSAELNCRR